jgi:hypothetical protein
VVPHWGEAGEQEVLHPVGEGGLEGVDPTPSRRGGSYGGYSCWRTRALALGEQEENEMARKTVASEDGTMWVDSTRSQPHSQPENWISDFRLWSEAGREN